MPWDIKLPFEWDQSGDAATVSGREFYAQIVTNATTLGITQTNSRGGPMTATDIHELESRIRDNIADSEYVTGTPTVVVSEVNDREVVVRVRLPLEETTYELQTTVER